MKTVAVFFGGKSNEREISVITGIYCANLLKSAYRVLPVYLDPSGGMLLAESGGVEDFRRQAEQKFRGAKRLAFVTGGLAPEGKPKKRIAVDCALNCCHGGMGEGGVLSALLEWFRIPSASPALAPSAVFLDKALSKFLLAGMGVPVLPSFALREREFAAGEWKERAARLGYPVIVKPCRLGSSIGIAVAKNEEALDEALRLAFRLDGAALVETYLEGKRDLNVAAYRAEERVVLSPVEEVFSAAPILTFGEKYEETGERQHELPARLPEGTAEKIAQTLACVYEQLDMCGIVRADFLLAPTGEVYFNELNTVPGTLAAYLFGESLTEARGLLVRLVEEGMRERPEKETVESGILSKPLFFGKNRSKMNI